MPDLMMVACVPVWALGEMDVPDGVDISNFSDPEKYTVVPCPECSMNMYLGKRSEQIIETMGYKAVCMVCAKAVTLAEGEDEVEVVTLTNGREKVFSFEQNKYVEDDDGLPS